MLDFVLTLLPMEVIAKGGITINGEFVELSAQMQTFLCCASICVFFICCGIVVSLFNILTDMFRNGV